MNVFLFVCSRFMAAGGWNLIHMWLTDGILAKNWALIQELLELLLLCPVDIERLKSNNCPKLIKGLSKEGSHQGVKSLATRLVEQWLKMVKGEVPSNTLIINQVPAVADVPDVKYDVKQEIKQEQCNDVQNDHVSSSHNNVMIKSVHQVTPKFEFDTVLTPSQNAPSQSELQPNCKLVTIRDGNQILSQVQLDPSINNVVSVESENNFEVVVKSEEGTDALDDVGAQCVIGSDNVDSGHVREGEKDLGNDKENRDKKSDKKSSSSSGVEKKSKSSSKHSSSKHSSSSKSSSSSSHRSSSKSSSSSSNNKDKSSSRDRDKHKHSSSSSSKSKSDKEKEKLRKEQAERDKATLEKVQNQSGLSSLKIGKIPKKKPEESDKGSPSRKLSTESKDSLKENKTDAKKVAPIPEKKTISMSIENRKNSQDSGSRPKTVKTFNSKFRSTGLEEEVTPNVSRNTKKPVTLPDKKLLLNNKLSLKRPSPAKDPIPVVEKKPKLDNNTVEEKKGGIKLIPPKPKRKLSFFSPKYENLIFFFF